MILKFGRLAKKSLIIPQQTRKFKNSPNEKKEVLLYD